MKPFDIRFVLLIFTTAIASCANGRTELVVDVNSTSVINGVDHLTVTVQQSPSGMMGSAAVPFPSTPSTIAPSPSVSFSLDFAGGYSGSVIVTVAAIDRSGISIANGSNTATLSPSASSEIKVTLTGGGPPGGDAGIDMSEPDLTMINAAGDQSMQRDLVMTAMDLAMKDLSTQPDLTMPPDMGPPPPTAPCPVMPSGQGMLDCNAIFACIGNQCQQGGNFDACVMNCAVQGTGKTVMDFCGLWVCLANTCAGSCPPNGTPGDCMTCRNNQNICQMQRGACVND